MAIAYCSSCEQNVYLTNQDEEICPVCAAGLNETEESIKLRLATN